MTAGSAATEISIHALLAESDDVRDVTVVRPEDFYPRSPCGERLMYLPTSPGECYFYPRSPCGERLLPTWDLYQMLRISIHALLAESDHTDVSTIFRG